MEQDGLIHPRTEMLVQLNSGILRPPLLSDLLRTRKYIIYMINVVYIV